MSTTEYVIRKFNEHDIRERQTDRYYDATAMCRANGKKWNDYFRLKSTSDFVDALASDAGGVSVSDMTDEQLGRAWCQANGKRPSLGLRWFGPMGDEPMMLPADVFGPIFFNTPAHYQYDTEDDAYAAVGAALRELQQRAKEIAEVLKGVPK